MKKTILNSHNEWNNALILWGIHWDEKSWTIAINRFISDIESKTIELLKDIIKIKGYINN